MPRDPRTWDEVEARFPNEAEEVQVAAPDEASETLIDGDQAEALGESISGDPLQVRRLHFETPGSRGVMRRSRARSVAFEDAEEANPLSDKFQPQAFLAQHHYDSSLDDLLTGLQHLETVRAQRRDQLKTLVATKFGSFVKCKDMVEMIGLNLRKRDLPNTILARIQSDVEEVLDDAEQVFESILHRQDATANARTALQLLRRFKFLLDLPSLMQRHFDMKEFDALVHDYKKGVRQETTGIEVFDKIIEEVGVLAAKFREYFEKRLDDPALALEEHERTIRYLIELGAPYDVGWRCISVRVQQLQTRVRELTHHYRTRITQTKRLSHVGPAAGSVALLTSELYADVTSQLHERLVQRVCDEIRQSLHSLSRISTMYFSGKFQKRGDSLDVLHQPADLNALVDPMMDALFVPMSKALLLEGPELVPLRSRHCILSLLSMLNSGLQKFISKPMHERFMSLVSTARLHFVKEVQHQYTARLHELFAQRFSPDDDNDQQALQDMLSRLRSRCEKLILSWTGTLRDVGTSPPGTELHAAVLDSFDRLCRSFADHLHELFVHLHGSASEGVVLVRLIGVAHEIMHESLQQWLTELVRPLLAGSEQAALSTAITPAQRDMISACSLVFSELLFLSAQRYVSLRSLHSLHLIGKQIRSDASVSGTLVVSEIRPYVFTVLLSFITTHSEMRTSPLLNELMQRMLQVVLNTFLQSVADESAGLQNTVASLLLTEIKFIVHVLRSFMSPSLKTQFRAVSDLLESTSGASRAASASYDELIARALRKTRTMFSCFVDS